MPVTDFECAIAKSQIGRYVSGDPLSSESIQQLEAHIAACPSCKELIQERRRALIEMLGLETNEPVRAVVSVPTHASTTGDAPAAEANARVKKKIRASKAPTTELTLRDAIANGSVVIANGIPAFSPIQEESHESTVPPIVSEPVKPEWGDIAVSYVPTNHPVDRTRAVIELPRVELPKISKPEIKLPKFDLQALIAKATAPFKAKVIQIKTSLALKGRQRELNRISRHAEQEADRAEPQPRRLLTGLGAIRDRIRPNSRTEAASPSPAQPNQKRAMVYAGALVAVVATMAVLSKNPTTLLGPRADEAKPGTIRMKQDVTLAAGFASGAEAIAKKPVAKKSVAKPNTSLETKKAASKATANKYAQQWKKIRTATPAIAKANATKATASKASPSKGATAKSTMIVKANTAKKPVTEPRLTMPTLNKKAGPTVTARVIRGRTTKTAPKPWGKPIAINAKKVSTGNGAATRNRKASAKATVRTAIAKKAASTSKKPKNSIRLYDENGNLIQ